MNTYTIADLKNKLALMQSEVEKTKSHLCKLLEQKKNLAGTITYLESEASLESEERVQVPVESPRNIDFSGARNLDERLKIIAESETSGIIRVTNAVDLILRSGVSKASRRSLSSSMYKTLNSSDDWEWLSPGEFRLLHPAIQGTLPDQYQQ